MKRSISSYSNKLFNSKITKDKRNDLRNNLTSTEFKLWKYLKNKQINGYKFRRQHGIGKFIVDFYCSEIKLVIEVDGANHFFDKKSTEYDIERQKFIELFGIMILRISSADINSNINGVIETISKVSEQRFLSMGDTRTLSPFSKGRQRGVLRQGKHTEQSC